MSRRELGPATLAVAQAVAAALTDEDNHLLVACSGGPDSLALAFGVHRAATREHRSLGAVVVDHDLQPDSAAVAERTREQLGRLGFADVVVSKVSVPPGAEVSVTLPSSGNVVFYCRFHQAAGMQGAFYFS